MIGTCDIFLGCSLVPLECPALTGNDSSCYRVYCDEKQGCVKQLIKNAYMLDGQKCPEEQKNSLSALAIVLCVISCVLFCILLFLIIRCCRQRRMRSLLKTERYSRVDKISENELYESGYAGGENPLFDGKI